MTRWSVSGLFGRPAPDQFSQVEWTAGGRGAPLMVGAIAHLECVNEAILDGGDHHILVGRVERFARFDGAPLLFAQGQYGVAESHPALADSPSLPAAPSRDLSEDMLFLSLLKATDQHMSALFQDYRHEVGVTPATGRVLNRLSVGSCTQETLEQDTFLGENTVEEALSDLLTNGQVEQGGGGNLGVDGAGTPGAVRAASQRRAVHRPTTPRNSGQGRGRRRTCPRHTAEPWRSRTMNTPPAPLPASDASPRQANAPWMASWSRTSPACWPDRCAR